MSYVADIILITMIDDYGEQDNCRNADKLSAYLQKNHNNQTLVKIDDYAGGNKAFQCDVFMSAINYLNIPEFVECFNGIKWEEPLCVQLLIKNENDDIFTIYTP